ILGGETGAGPCRAARAASGTTGAAKTGKARIAVGVDFAAVELGPLLGIAQQIIGMRCLGKLGVSRRVFGILVRVIFLGQLAIGGLDVLLACGPWYPEHGVRIAHLVQSSVVRRCFAYNSSPIWPRPLRLSSL